jgi:hypothetical protein
LVGAGWTGGRGRPVYPGLRGVTADDVDLLAAIEETAMQHVGLDA